MPFLNILVVFRLDLNQITFELVEKAFATQRFAFLATGIAFYNVSTRACTEIKILRLLRILRFLDEKVTYVFRLWIFGIFFHLSFFSFSSLFAAVIDLLLGLLAVKKLLRKHHRDRQFLIKNINRKNST